MIELEPHGDERGFFARTFCAQEFSAHGLPTQFPQTNLSRNRRAGTLRGMHYNAAPFEEGKLVRATSGAVHDIVVDLRPTSTTRYQSFGVELSASAGTSLFVPAGFAHGFITLSDDTDVVYHMSESYSAQAARGFRWNDPNFALRWPREVAVIAPRDASYPDFSEEGHHV